MRIHQFLSDQAATRPQAIALLDWDAAPWTFAQELAAAQAAAAHMTAAGVQPGDRVLMVTENCATLCAFIYACSMIGAWAVPVNARQTAHELARIIDHATPKLGLFFHSVSPDAQSHGTRPTPPRSQAHGARSSPQTSAPPIPPAIRTSPSCSTQPAPQAPPRA
jgi:long-chain acyl-CoA synthetase